MDSIGVDNSDLRVIGALEADDRRELLTLARTAISDAATTGVRSLPDMAGLPPRLREPGTSFVTLRRAGEPVGTTGEVAALRPLGIDVAANALTAAFDDPRIPPIESSDLAELSIEISILGPLVPTDSTSFDDLRSRIDGKHEGLVVGNADRRVTFLPAVWGEVRDTDDFLALLWRKAGMAPGEWSPELSTATYRAETISDRPPS